MRVTILAAASLLAAIGSAAAAQSTARDWHLKRDQLEVRTGVTDGMTGAEAVTVQGDAGLGGWQGSFRHPLAKTFSLLDWRGQRVRVTLRLKTQGDMRAYTRFELFPGASDTILSEPQKQDGHDWELRSFVADVPRRDVSHLHILVGLLGKGAVWIDEVAIEAVDKKVALSPARRLNAGAGQDWGNSLPINGDYGGGYTPPVSAPSPVGTGVINR